MDPKDEKKDDQHKEMNPVLRFILAQVFVLALIGVFIVGMGTVASVTNPGVFALVLVLAVVFLMTTLFILASGFSHLELTNAGQPLGLPEGSVRAMIALILILVFIMFGAYLYTQELTYADPGVGPIEMSREQYMGLPNVISAEPVEGTTNRYTVYMASPGADDSNRLAQQLLTTVGTLVVAVAGFYFGSASAPGSGTSGAGPAPTGPTGPTSDGGATGDQTRAGTVPSPTGPAGPTVGPSPMEPSATPMTSGPGPLS